MIEGGTSLCEVARQMGKSKSVISRLWDKYRQTGGVAMRPGRGRPKSTTPRQDRLITLLALRDRFKSAAAINREFLTMPGRRISTSTVKNRLYQARLKAGRPFKGVTLSAHHKRQRLAWARQHQGRAMRHWRYAMFSDESRFCLRFTDGRKRCWRRSGERYARAAILDHDRYGGDSVMGWGGVTYDRRSDLVITNGAMTGQRYVDQILRPVVAPLARIIGRNFEFQDDNARPHRAQVVSAYLRQEGIQTLDWPSKSPDLSPIEHLWDVLGRRVYARDPGPANLAQLGAALQEEWRAIPRATIRKLINSMPSRCRECVAQHGGHTRY